MRYRKQATQLKGGKSPMWGYNLMNNDYNNSAPGMMATTLARVIVNRANKKVSQIEAVSQIAGFEEELHQAG